VSESFVGHYRPEVRAADTYINNVPNSLTCMPDPFAAPDPVTKVAILSSTSWTAGTTFLPSTRMVAFFGARNATCSTARFSVVLFLAAKQ